MTYEYGKDCRDKWRWQLKGDNQKVVAIGNNGYNHRQDCLAAIEKVMKSIDAKVVQLDFITVEVT